MSFTFAMQALRRHVVLVLATVVVVTGAGFAIGSYWPKTYTSHAQILLGMKIAGSTIDPQTANLYLKDRAMTYAQLVVADEVIAPVAAATKISAEVLRENVVGSIVPETVVLGVSVTGSTPEEAVALTKALSASFQKQVSSLNVRTGGPAILPAQLSSPQLPVAPDQLHGKMLIAVSALAGLVIGALLALVLGLVDVSRGSRRAAKSSDEVERAGTNVTVTDPTPTAAPFATEPTPTRTPLEEPHQPLFGAVTLKDDLPQSANGIDRRGRVPYMTTGINTGATASRPPERRDRAHERRINGSQNFGRHSGDSVAHDR